MAKLRKRQRQEALSELLERNPFLTDQELAARFGVSIQTIRLDRMELGLPELRERLKQVAEQAYGRVKSVSSTDIIGDLIEINLDESALSVLDTDSSMTFAASEIVRGHHIFAQANSLAAALVDAPVALTGSAQIKYLAPVYAGQRIVAKAKVTKIEGRKRLIKVRSYVGDKDVFVGDFTLFALANSSEDKR
ncbi:MAG: transcription factor FapR [Firmicutes bacterium]|nr:transcription factor FapR [Bacillota bacterium]